MLSPSIRKHSVRIADLDIMSPSGERSVLHKEVIHIDDWADDRRNGAEGYHALLHGGFAFVTCVHESLPDADDLEHPAGQ